MKNKEKEIFIRGILIGIFYFLGIVFSNTFFKIINRRGRWNTNSPNQNNTLEVKYRIFKRGD